MILHFFRKLNLALSTNNGDDGGGEVWYECYHADRAGLRCPLKVTKAMHNNYKREHQVLLLQYNACILTPV
jgi:hypothetical protein